MVFPFYSAQATAHNHNCDANSYYNSGQNNYICVFKKFICNATGLVVASIECTVKNYTFIALKNGYSSDIVFTLWLNFDHVPSWAYRSCIVCSPVEINSASVHITQFWPAFISWFVTYEIHLCSIDFLSRHITHRPKFVWNWEALFSFGNIFYAWS